MPQPCDPDFTMSPNVGSAFDERSGLRELHPRPGHGKPGSWLLEEDRVEFSEMETPGFAPGTRPCGGRVILVSPCPQERENRSAAQESHLPGPRGHPGYSRHRLSTDLATEEDAPAWSCTRVSTFARWRLGSARPRKHVRGVRGDAPTWSCTRVSAFGERRLDLLGHGGEFVRMDPPGLAPGPSGFQPGALLLELEIRGSPPGSCTPIQAVRAPRPAVEREGRGERRYGGAGSRARFSGS